MQNSMQLMILPPNLVYVAHIMASPSYECLKLRSQNSITGSIKLNGPVTLTLLAADTSLLCAKKSRVLKDLFR